MAEKKTKRRVATIAVSFVIVLALILGAGTIYLTDFYKSDEEAISVFLAQDISQVKETEDMIVFEAENAENGFIFYPGGKVEYRAYIPLMQLLCERGIHCVLVKMPFNLAVLQPDAAEGIQEKFPKIKNWYIGGHSLGGSMAATYLSENIDEYKGLVLLASYSIADISDSKAEVLSVLGSEDKIINMDNYNENKANLPEDFTEIVIDGGCHAFFGMYGPQEGDGIPEIDNGEQIRLTAEHIASMIVKAEEVK